MTADSLLPVAEAFARVLAHVPRWPETSVPIIEAAGRVLARPIAADRDQPPFDRVTMDGIALAALSVAQGATRLPVVGVQATGAPAGEEVPAGACREVMTGAVLPPGTDTVVPIEQLSLAEGVATLLDPDAIEPYQFVHRQGTDYASGALLLAPGTALGAAEVAVLASVGCASVRVGGLPRATVISTGDELVAAEDPVAPHQIRRANDYAIAAALYRRGITSPAILHLRDDPATLRQAVAGALAASDVLILSGGVSRGRFDHLPGILAELGVERVFHRVSQRPGKPLWFGMDGPRCVFALPGNPVSALVCLHRYVLPALVKGAGGEPAFGAVTLGADVAFRGPLTRFVPVTRGRDGDGRPVVWPRELNTSGDFFGLAGTDGFVELDGARSHWHAGETVRFVPW